MEILLFIWIELLYRPLLNFLIWTYNTVGFYNLGLAIIWMTIIIRTILLPLSLKDKKTKNKRLNLENQLLELKKRFANNPSTLRQLQRILLNQARFRRWTVVITLGAQGLILLVLYRVFTGGFKLNNIVDQIYSFIDIPVQMNTVFLGIDLQQPSFILSIIPTVLLFIQIYTQFKINKKPFTRNDLPLLVGFPLFTFAFLYFLPSVKALFVLVSMVYSDIITLLQGFNTSVKDQKQIMEENSKKKQTLKDNSLPAIQDRF